MLIFWLALLLFVLAAAVTTAYAAWRAAPYVPTLGRDVVRMLDLAAVKDGEKVYDLGAGDGRLMLAALKRGTRVTAVGYELSIPVYLVARLRLWLARAGARADLRWQDFFKHSLAGADVVTCFLTPEAMRKLEPKFKTELRPGARIVSAVFPLPNWPPQTKDKPAGRVSVYLYRV